MNIIFQYRSINKFKEPIFSKSKLKTVSLIVFLFYCQNSYSQSAQSRNQLEKEKKVRLQKIIKAKQVLAETRQQKEASLGKVKALNHEINEQVEQLQLLNRDFDLLGLEVKELNKQKVDLNSKLTNLKSEYGKTLYNVSKKNTKLNQLSFLFSSESFSELMMRYKYLEQYTDSRKKQLAEINEISKLIEHRQNVLIQKQKAQNQIIITKKSEAQKLEDLKGEQSKVIAELSDKETELRAEIEKNKNSVLKLNSVISNLIRKDVSTRNTPNKTVSNSKVSKKESKEEPEDQPSEKIETAVAENKSTKNTIPKAKSISNSGFGSNKSRLPWPVNNGFVSDRFGIKNHEFLKGVKIENNGIDIQTSANTNVHAVYDGIVMDVTEIPGLNKVVAIQHGDYYTIYANLTDIQVSIGQSIKRGQNLGQVSRKNGTPEINFQIWHKFNKLNPENWLSSR